MIPNSIWELNLSMEAVYLYTWLTSKADKDGTVVTSRSQISKALGLSEQSVRTALDKLEVTKLVTKELTNKSTNKSTNRQSCITVCYLASYKGRKSATNQQINQPSNQASNQINNQVLEESPLVPSDKEMPPVPPKEINTPIPPKEESQDKENNLKETSSWRTDKSIYDSLIHQAQERLLADKEYKAQVEELHPNIDYERTVKAAALFWLDEEQYRKYKLKRTKSPNFVSTLKNGLQYSRIWKNRKTTPATPVLHDMSELTDVAYNYEYFMIWVEKFCPRISGTINKGWPTSDKEYQHLAAHTEGGCKGLCYAMLQLEHQGYEKYKDDNGMMFIFANYIKANGMFIAG